jgi:hypothetical protein
MASSYLDQDTSIIEAPWLVNGGHGASLRHHKDTSIGAGNGSRNIGDSQTIREI